MGWFSRTFGRPATQPATPAPAAAAAPAAHWRTEGNAALAQGRFAEAARCYEQGIVADPVDATLRLNLGFALLEQGDAKAAAGWLQQALALRRPADDFVHEAHLLLGRAQAALGRADAALASFDAAARARADFAEPLQEGIELLRSLERHGEAVAWARRLVHLQPTPGHRLLLARKLLATGEAAEASQVLAQLCVEEPANVDASVLLFQAHMRTRRFAEALAEAQRLAGFAGRQPPVLLNAAAALDGLGRIDEALAHLDEALRLDPGYHDARANRAGVLLSAGRLRECIATAHEALRARPDDPSVHWNLGFAHLTLGEFAEGWQEHEWRFRAFPHTVMHLDQPQWRGESLAGRRILLHGEQGFGDNIQFVRYLPVVAAQAGAVYLLVPQALEPLMTALPSNCRLLPQGALLPPIDCHCPLMSLPAVLGTTEASIPAQVPYLQADPVRVAAWRERLPRDRLNVGIAWSGKPSHSNDHNRSLTLDAFRAVDAPGCRFVTLQPQLRDSDLPALAAWPQVLQAGSELRDFSDTAALVQALDLVVTVDTSVAHLAGALARPVWILLPRVPDWRWMLEREDSPWYPTARLYRQGPARSWPDVLARVRTDLGALVARHPA